MSEEIKNEKAKVPQEDLKRLKAVVDSSDSRLDENQKEFRKKYEVESNGKKKKFNPIENDLKRYEGLEDCSFITDEMRNTLEEMRVGANLDRIRYGAIARITICQYHIILKSTAPSPEILSAFNIASKSIVDSYKEEILKLHDKGEINHLASEARNRLESLYGVKPNLPQKDDEKASSSESK